MHVVLEASAGREHSAKETVWVIRMRLDSVALKQASPASSALRWSCISAGPRSFRPGLDRKCGQGLLELVALCGVPLEKQKSPKQSLAGNTLDPSEQLNPSLPA